jgi:hypothetical protein
LEKRKRNDQSCILLHIVSKPTHLTFTWKEKGVSSDAPAALIRRIDNDNTHKWEIFTPERTWLGFTRGRVHAEEASQLTEYDIPNPASGAHTPHIPIKSPSQVLVPQPAAQEQTQNKQKHQ